MADLLAVFQRRFKSLILASTAFVLIAAAALQLVHLRLARDRTLRAAEARAANLASVLSEYVRGSFAAIDTSLRQLSAHSLSLGGAAAPNGAWAPLLAAADAALPGYGSVSVVDAAGVIRHSTLALIVGQPRRDSYAYQRLSTMNVDELVIDPPFLSLTEPKQFVLPVGRPLRQADGAFDGVVVATVRLEGFRQFFRTVDVGSRGAVWVFHPDRAVLLREPSAGTRLDQPATGQPVIQAAAGAAASGIINGPLAPGGSPFISAYDWVESPRLLVAISLDETEVLQDWHDQRLSAAVAFGLLSLTLGGIVAVAFGQMDARTRVEDQLREVQHLEAERLRSANQRLAEALDREQQARRESEQASYMKDEFLMTVSHELRTPLNSIYGWMRMLASDALAPDERSRAVAAVERNARAQARIIEDLLDVSSSITGKLRLDPRPTSIADTVLAAIETAKPALEAKGLEFESYVEPGIPPILADPDRIQQIAWNLLSNAIKFTPAGGRVTLHAARVGGSVEIMVTDTGVGIEPDLLPFVFDRFRQGEAGPRRRYGGLGLGLAIVRPLVELHGGTVTAESEGAGHGTTVRVRIPARRVPPSTPEHNSSS